MHGHFCACRSAPLFARKSADFRPKRHTPPPTRGGAVHMSYLYAPSRRRGPTSSGSLPMARPASRPPPRSSRPRRTIIARVERTGKRPGLWQAHPPRLTHEIVRAYRLEHRVRESCATPLHSTAARAQRRAGGGSRMGQCTPPLRSALSPPSLYALPCNFRAARMDRCP